VEQRGLDNSERKFDQRHAEFGVITLKCHCWTPSPSPGFLLTDAIFRFGRHLT
jgi:hypothetical protein